jgi:hypothetical protein
MHERVVAAAKKRAVVHTGRAAVLPWFDNGEDHTTRAADRSPERAFLVT